MERVAAARGAEEARRVEGRGMVAAWREGGWELVVAQREGTMAEGERGEGVPMAVAVARATNP